MKEPKLPFQYIIYSLGSILLLSFLLTCRSCLNIAGIHGSIKSYQYAVPKQTLQSAIEKIIAEGGNICRDTIVNYIIDETGGKHDTLWDNYYNDTENYVTIYIVNGELKNQYTFRYSGDKQDWDTSKTSEIFIAYAYDANDNGGSDGNGGVTWYTPFLKKRLTSLFEKEFISKIDKELGMKHTEE